MKSSLWHPELTHFLHSCTLLSMTLYILYVYFIIFQNFLFIFYIHKSVRTKDTRLPLPLIRYCRPVPIVHNMRPATNHISSERPIIISLPCFTEPILTMPDRRCIGRVKNKYFHTDNFRRWCLSYTYAYHRVYRD